MNASREPINIKSPTLHATIWFTMFVFVAAIVMACIFAVEIVARGQGKVVPISRVQVVEPEFDGKITAIHIRNGSEVQKGDVLIELDATDAEAELNTITSEITRLTIERARITALVSSIDNLEIQTETFAAQTLKAFAASSETSQAFYQEQSGLLAAEVDDLQAAMSQISARISANDQSVAVTQANIERIEAAISIQRKRLKAAQTLLNQGASSRSAFLDVQGEFTELQKERDVNLRELDQKRSLEITFQAERRSIITAQRNQLLQRRSEIEARLAVLEEQLRSSERRMIAAKLTAPMSGIVDQLEVFTIGAVTQGGEQLLRVVPEDQNVEIEAVFSNIDIGFLEIGQTVNINLDAYPSERFGHVKGTVSDVAADSTEVTEGVWIFQVRIKLLENVLIHGNDEFRIRPGMTGVVDVTTGKRKLISYFFAPIVATVRSALSER